MASAETKRHFIPFQTERWRIENQKKKRNLKTKNQNISSSSFLSLTSKERSERERERLHLRIRQTVSSVLERHNRIVGIGNGRRRGGNHFTTTTTVINTISPIGDHHLVILSKERVSSNFTTTITTASTTISTTSSTNSNRLSVIGGGVKVHRRAGILADGLAGHPTARRLNVAAENGVEITFLRGLPKQTNKQKTNKS